MRICSPQLGLSPQSVLGGEVYDRQVIAEFVKTNHQVYALLPKHHNYKAHRRLKVSFAPLSHIVPPHLYNLFIVPYVLKLINQNKIDLLRIHVPEFFGPSAWLLKKFKPQLPIIGHYHLDESGLIFSFINRLFLNCHDLIIADSHYLKKQIIKKFKIKPQKIKVIHCGTDVKAITPGNKDPVLVRKYQLQDQIVILYLGLFIKRKNPHFLIKVFAKLHANYPNTKLIMIGKGPEEFNLKILAKNLKLKPHVIFPGPQYDKQKLAFYRTADIFAFPSHNEGFVLSVLEAMAAGLPLLVPKTVSFPEAVIHGKNGLLAKPNHQADWVNKLSRLIKDVKLRQQLAQNARVRAQAEFSITVCAKQNLKIYQSLLK